MNTIFLCFCPQEEEEAEAEEKIISGNGWNYLGTQLMLIRDEITGKTEWTKWINANFDAKLKPGKPHPPAKWQPTVKEARDKVHNKYNLPGVYTFTPNLPEDKGL